MPIKKQTSRTGFTIVELLIVIVVIAILAAITIIAYNGIQDRARKVAFVSALRNGFGQVESQKTAEGYPASVNFPSSSAPALTYSQVAAGEAFCLEARNVSITPGAVQFTSQNNKPHVGPCPLGFWPLDDTSGADDSPYIRNGATVGSPIVVTDRFGEQKALSFNGVGKRFSVDSPVAHTGPFAVSVWHKRDDTHSSTTWRTLFGHASANIHHLIINEATRTMGVFDGGWKDFGYTVPNDGAWHHYAVVYTPATSSAVLYVDGVVRGTVSTSLALATNPIGSIGNWGGGTYWAGPIDDASVYGRALTPSEIQYLAQNR